MKNLLLIAITILAVGCGGKDESTTETKPVEEKVLEVKEEVKPELEGVNEDELEERKGIVYNGKGVGLAVTWYEDGQKKSEQNYKDGKPVDGSLKYWNSKGEPVDSLEEAE